VKLVIEQLVSVLYYQASKLLSDITHGRVFLSNISSLKLEILFKNTLPQVICPTTISSLDYNVYLFFIHLFVMSQIILLCTFSQEQAASAQ